MFHRDGEKGIKTYGNRAVVAILNKYKKLNTLTVFVPQEPDLVSQQEQYTTTSHKYH